VLHETGETIKSGYFLNDGLGSVLTTEPNGNTVEVGLIGNKGFVGLPIIFGFKTSGLRVFTQADATAYRVEAATLLKILPQVPRTGKAASAFLDDARNAVHPNCRLQSPAWRRREVGKMAADESGPGWQPNTSPHTGIPRSDARYSPGQCHHRGGNFAKCRTHQGFTRKCNHSR
jgi:hypothetical protein